MSAKPIHFYFSKLSPERLTAGRELRKLTKTALADLIGKSSSAVSQFESGKSGLDLVTFQRIIDVLNLPAVFFTINDDTSAADYDMARCHFRAKRNVSQLERYQSSRYAEQVISIYNSLEHLGIQFPIPNIPSLSRSGQAISENQIEKIAENIRSFWELGIGPIPDMASLLESLGVRIILLPDDSKNIDGFSTWVGDKPYIMVVGSSCASRLQFDYAHELAHLLLHIEDVPGELDTERVANRFAGAFLMPFSSYTVEGPKSWQGTRVLFDVKNRWYVSIAAALFRSRQIGIMRESAYKWAMIKLSESGQRTEERGEFEKPKPTLLQQAIELIANDICLEEFAELACMSADMLEAILKEQGIPPEIIEPMKPKLSQTRRAKVLRFSNIK